MLVLVNIRGVVVVFADVDDDTVVRTLGDGEGAGPRQLQYPYDLAVLDGDLADAVASDDPVAVVADTFNHRLVLLRVRDGMLIRHVGTGGRCCVSIQLPHHRNGSAGACDGERRDLAGGGRRQTCSSLDSNGDGGARSSRRY